MHTRQAFCHPSYIPSPNTDWHYSKVCRLQQPSSECYSIQMELSKFRPQHHCFSAVCVQAATEPLWIASEERGLHIPNLELSFMVFSLLTNEPRALQMSDEYPTSKLWPILAPTFGWIHHPGTFRMTFLNHSLWGKYGSFCEPCVCEGP